MCAQGLWPPLTGSGAVLGAGACLAPVGSMAPWPGLSLPALGTGVEQALVRLA